MRFKRLLALLLAAALALSLLVGCGGGKNQSLSQMLLNLLDGQYQNVSVEIDSDLEAKLRQAISESETDEELRAALEKLLGSGVSFRLIGDGQKGDSAWNLILYPGSDPDAAARSAYLEWDKIFSAFPSSGLYTAKLSMIETDNGYAILVKATVDKAARRNDDDDDEPEEPEEEIPESGYKKIDDTSYKVYNDIGLTSVLFGDDDSSGLAAARNSGFKDVTIELAAGSYSVSKTFGSVSDPFLGTLKGESPADKATITLNEGSNGLFAQIGVDGGTSGSNGKVENITFKVEENISNTYSYNDKGTVYICAGAAAGRNYGEITNCDVTIGSNYTIRAEASFSNIYAGGLVGENHGTITNCTVTIENGGSIQANDANYAHAGGIAGYNYGMITETNQVTLNSGGTITSTGKLGATAGGLVGDNENTVTGTYSGSGDISATATASSATAGGLAGYNNYSGTVTGTYSGDGEISATATAANGRACAGGLVGGNDGKVTATSGSSDAVKVSAKANSKLAVVKEGIGGTGNFPASGEAYAGTQVGFQYGS